MLLKNDGGSYHNTTFAALTAALPSSDVMPSSDPGGASSYWWVPSAYGRMLGISTFTPAAGNFDDQVHLNSDYSWDFGQDVIAGLIHELSEGVMGRVGRLGQPGGAGGASWSTMDLFRYNSSGAYDVTNGTDGKDAYFSSDGGKTKSAGYQLNNQLSPTSTTPNGVDSADWVGDGYNGSGKVFGGVAPKSTLDLASTELSVMQALGWSVQMPQDFMKTSGSWQDPTKWSMSCMPIATPEDAYIGGVSNVVNATLATDAAVNSIGTGAGDSLEIQNNSTLIAWNGTQINSATVGSTLTGNAGSLIVDSGSKLQTDIAFNNSGVLALGQANGFGAGTWYLGGVPALALSGGGRVTLGSGGLSSGAIATDPNYPTGLTNVDNTISGGGSIAVSAFDNQAHGTVVASQSGGNWLTINASTFSNEGVMNATTNATLNFGSYGATRALTNTGVVNIGWDGANADTGARLAVSGTFTISGGGSLALRGAGAKIASDGLLAATFINQSNLGIQASAQVGDIGVYSGNHLTFVNRGALIASGGTGVVATLDTGANTIDDGGGVLEAVGGATLAIKSNVTTGQSYTNGAAALPGGVIEAISGGKINLTAAITAGPPAPSGSTLASGKVVVQFAANLTILSGGSISTPVSIAGPAAQFGGGVVNVQAGGKLTGPVTFTSAGAKLNLINVTASVSATGNGGIVSLSNSKVSLSGGSETVTFGGNEGNAVTLANTAGAWDTVNGSNGTVALNGAEASVVGGGNVVNAISGSKLSLYSTNGAWDTVNGSGLQIVFIKSESSLVGGGETVYADAGSQVSLYSTGGNWDAINGAGLSVILNSSQAAVYGGGNYVYANSGSSLSLFNTNGVWDSVAGSGLQVTVASAQAAFAGGANIIYASAASKISLSATKENWDTVYGAGANVTLDAAQASLVGDGDVIYANADATASLYGVAGSAWDTFYGSNDYVLLTNANASIVGGSDKISANVGSSVSLYNTGAAADTVNASSVHLTLSNAQATVTGDHDVTNFVGNDALTMVGSHETFTFGKQLGTSSVAGYNSTDLLTLSAADWASYSALLASGDLKQSGANTIISTDASNLITLLNVQATSLTAAQIAFL